MSSSCSVPPAPTSAEGGIVLSGPQTLGGRRSPVCEAPRMSAACMREVHP